MAIALAIGGITVGCGPPDELSRADARALDASRSDIGDALDTEERIRTSKAEAVRLRTTVQKTVSTGSFEAGKPDEFGLAALGELRQVAPSLVRERSDGTVFALNAPATRDFLQYAATDPRRALLRPVREEVRTIEQVLDRSGAGPDTRLPAPDRTGSGDETVGSYLREIEGDLRPRYPAEADRIGKAREQLSA
ncbi:MAG: hypothetical protein ACR2HC_05220 [Thermoleophilaceae bacterium]